MSKIRVRCPICKAEAEIDKEKKLLVIYVPPPKVPERSTLYTPPITTCFPSHFDCELSKPIDQINIDKLVRVEAKQ